MTLNVWIPGDTTAQHRKCLPENIALHDLPKDASGHLGPGEFLIGEQSADELLQIIPRLDGLKVIQTFAAGVDHLVERLPQDVILCDGSGIHDIPLAEWIVMTLLATRHGLLRYFGEQRLGRWPRIGADAGGDDLDGMTVLIIGYGSIGRALETRLRPFEVEVLRVARQARDGVSTLSDLPTLVPRADAVVLLAPLTDETRGLVDATFLSMMRQDAVLVNAARGRLVDTDALVAAVQDGHVRAALDVTDPEPLPAGHPLWSEPGVIITPHIAGWARKRYDRAWKLAGEQLDRYLKDEPLINVVSDGY